MSALEYLKHKVISLKQHPDFNECWLQNRIAEDPSILGLGDLILKDKEKIQPKAGKLDLLFHDSEANQRYEVEIQLGRTDESHLVRTLEYWDIERKRYPQYDHVAVIVAEDVTSRFLNIIGLFNGYIPLIAIQLNAVQIGNNISLVFTKVLDQMTLGTDEEDEDDVTTVDRSFWENRSSKQILEMADNVLDLIKTFAPEYSLKYNTPYIGLAKNGQANNFALFYPKKKFMWLTVRLNKSQELEEKVNEAGLDLVNYTKHGRYRIRLTNEDIHENQDILKEMLQKSYNESME